jgi:hypothetical protein
MEWESIVAALSHMLAARPPRHGEAYPLESWRHGRASQRAQIRSKVIMETRIEATLGLTSAAVGDPDLLQHSPVLISRPFSSHAKNNHASMIQKAPLSM